MKALQLSLLLVLLAASAHTHQVRCLIRNAFWANQNLLTCFGEEVSDSCPCADEEVQEELNITNPPTDFPPGTNETDLEGVYIKDKQLKNFFKRLYKRFSKLKALEIDGTELETLTDEHFRGLTVLIYVSFPRNKFKKLPGRLFRHVPNLRWVKFHGNTQLGNIGFNLFKHLQFLRELNLGGAGCANEVITDSDLLTRLAGRLMGSCPPDPDDFEEDMNNMECEWKESGSKSKGN